MIRLIHSNKKIFLLVLLMVLLFCGQGWATNYYFADSGSGGSDANPCSSATCTNSASPCETIECVNEVLDDLGSGTHAIYFNKGNTFVISDADKRLGFRNTSSAAIDYPATVNLIFDQYDKDSYPGSGDPNIYSTVSCSLYNYAMFVINDTDVGNVTIQNLSFSGEGGNIACQGVNLDNVSGNVDFNNNTIDFNGSNDTANALDAMVAFRYRWYSSTNGNITVHDNTIYDITSSGSPEADKDGIGIRLGCDSCDLKTSGTVDIYNNTVYGVNSDCIQVQSVLLSGSTLNIYNNTLYNFGENAIDLKGSSNTAIYHNVMYRGNWAQGGESRGGTLTWSAVANGDDAIYENYFGENDKTGAIYAMNYTAGRTLSVYRNYFYDTITAVSMEEGILKFYNNVYYNTKGQDGRSSVGGTPVGTNAAMWFNDTSSGMESGTAIINNTFWAQPAASPTGRSHDDVIMIYEGTVDLQNNIFYLDFDDSDAYPVDCYSGSSKTITLDNNVYFNNQNSNTIDTSSCGAISDSNAVTTIPGWSTFPEVANGGNLHNQGDNTVGATYDDAIFWPGSTWTPAASIDVWTYDQDLVGAGWEIGAVVYGSDPPTNKGSFGGGARIQSN